jgi:ornithine cyclodeaminase/alanine dehydrogenase-like protein (mu-crystallin family)
MVKSILPEFEPADDSHVDASAPIFVTEKDVREWVRLEHIMPVVKDAFIALGEGRSTIFPLSRGTGSDPSHFFGIKAGRDGASGFLGVKAGSYIPSNRLRGMQAHTSTTMLFDDETGAFVGVVEANYLNGIRTAAANGVATDLLARHDSTTLGIIGLGPQAECEVMAVCAVRPITRILASMRNPASNAAFAASISAQTGIDVEMTSAEEVVRSADILVTATPSRYPVLETEWVRPGTHISAMGADDVGKQELPVTLVARASLVVDLAQQAARIGEAQYVVSQSLTTIDQLEERSLGKLLASKDVGRRDRDEITIFDSSGLAIQDVAAAAAAVRLVRAGRYAAARSGR